MTWRRDLEQLFPFSGSHVLPQCRGEKGLGDSCFPILRCFKAAGPFCTSDGHWGTGNRSHSGHSESFPLSCGPRGSSLVLCEHRVRTHFLDALSLPCPADFLQTLCLPFLQQTVNSMGRRQINALGRILFSSFRNQSPSFLSAS